MDPAIAATLIGVLVAALLGVFAGAFHLLRSDIKELRTENRSNLAEFRTEYSSDRRETNARIDRLEGKVDRLEGKVDRLEGKVDMLILALARDQADTASSTRPNKRQAPPDALQRG